MTFLHKTGCDYGAIGLSLNASLLAAPYLVQWHSLLLFLSSLCFFYLYSTFIYIRIYHIFYLYCREAGDHSKGVWLTAWVGRSASPPASRWPWPLRTSVAWCGKMGCPWSTNEIMHAKYLKERLKHKENLPQWMFAVNLAIPQVSGQLLMSLPLSFGSFTHYKHNTHLVPSSDFLMELLSVLIYDDDRKLWHSS